MKDKFDGFVRWMRLNIPRVEEMWISLNRKKIEKDRNKFDELVTQYVAAKTRDEENIAQLESTLLINDDINVEKKIDVFVHAYLVNTDEGRKIRIELRDSISKRYIIRYHIDSMSISNMMSFIQGVPATAQIHNVFGVVGKKLERKVIKLRDPRLLNLGEGEEAQNILNQIVQERRKVYMRDGWHLETPRLKAAVIDAEMCEVLVTMERISPQESVQ